MQSSSLLNQCKNRGDETAGKKSIPSGISVYQKCQIPNVHRDEQISDFRRCSILSLFNNVLSVGTWKAVGTWKVA